MAHPDDYNDPIRDACELISSLNHDLGSMPAFKVGSQWHTDRVAERERLHAKLKALYAEQDSLLAARPDVAPETCDEERVPGPASFQGRQATHRSGHLATGGSQPAIPKVAGGARPPRGTGFGGCTRK
jgi:hypothetical protein